MGERIVVMKDGLIHQVATPNDLYQFPVNKFVAGFIGSPPMNFLDGKVVAEEGLFHFKTDEFKVPLVPEISERIKPYQDREICLGVRPEHVLIGDGGHISARIEIVEPLGNETLLHLRMGENLLLCRRFVTGEIRKVDQEVKISFEQDQLRFFDPQTEKSILGY